MSKNTATSYQLPVTSKTKEIVLLGSTGTIGQNTLKIIEAHPERFTLIALTASDNVELLIRQALKFQPAYVAIANESHYEILKNALDGTGIKVAAGDDAICEAARMDADMVLSAIVGAAGLKPTLAAVHAGTTIALANKESLVCAGDVITREAAKYKATLLPVDSEHNAIFQLLYRDDTNWESVEHVTLTASGGPFRQWSLEQMKTATPAQAVKHPNWNMGAKISVDSATLMNKGLEMIEAFHLFPLRAEQIKVLVHPESIVHCLVHMVDGSVLAQMSHPDMCTPIAYALSWPERITAPVKKLDFTQIKTLNFEAPDDMRFPALTLARDALKAGGSAPCVLNAANEIAVGRFLKSEIGFLDIVKTVEKTLEKVDNIPLKTIDDVLACDAHARQLAKGL